jgi:UDP-3-O-[3-hydroxymyristoyl] glucosamine N-acyltransferase
MSTQNFFERGQGLTVREIAALTGAQPHRAADLDRRITGIAALDLATPDDLAFLDGAKFVAQAPMTAAGACLTTDRHAGAIPARTSILCTREPYVAFVETARALFPDALQPSSLFEIKGAHSSAVIHPTARLENAVTIDPGAVIGPRAEIGSETVVGPGVVIGPGVRIGRNCSIGAKSTVVHALIGDRVIVHAGCSIGQDGFGFAPGPTGARKIPQVGRVIVQDDVEIGANTTIDRGAIRDTVIGEGTKIDNLVQIAHNVIIGRACLICGMVGISGSVTIGDQVVLGGGVGVADHISIGSGALIGAASGVGTNVPENARYSGLPAVPHDRALQNYLYSGRQKALHQQVEQLAARIGRLEQSAPDVDNES